MTDAEKNPCRYVLLEKMSAREWAERKRQGTREAHPEKVEILSQSTFLFCV